MATTEQFKSPSPYLPGLAGGRGRENIRNRAQLSGGSSIIYSRPGEGTTVTVQIPYE